MCLQALTLFAPGKSWDNVRSTAAPYTESRLTHLVRNKCVGFPVVEQRYGSADPVPDPDPHQWHGSATLEISIIHGHFQGLWGTLNFWGSNNVPLFSFRPTLNTSLKQLIFLPKPALIKPVLWSRSPEPRGPDMNFQIAGGSGSNSGFGSDTFIIIKDFKNFLFKKFIVAEVVFENFTILIPTV
jgi:hypothetical protein